MLIFYADFIHNVAAFPAQWNQERPISFHPFVNAESLTLVKQNNRT